MEFVAIFASITVGCLAVLLALFERWSPDRSRIRRRLLGEFTGASMPDASALLYKEATPWDGELGPERVKTRSRIERNWGPWIAGWRKRLFDYLAEAGLAPTDRQIATAIAGAIVLPFGVGWALSGSLAACGAMIVGAISLVGTIAARRMGRREKYLKQLVGAFELMARVLRTGKSVNESIRATTEAFGDPLSTEFTLCLHEIEHGLRPEDAFRGLSLRSGILELRIFVIAMTIQRQTGGNLADMLDRLAGIVRARLLLRKRLRALTAEGRMQSVSLIVLPFLTFAVMYVLNRQYAEKLLENWRLLVITLGCMAIGVGWIRNIMKFEY